jgi:hypothetical protein
MSRLEATVAEHQRTFTDMTTSKIAADAAFQDLQRHYAAMQTLLSSTSAACELKSSEVRSLLGADLLVACMRFAYFLCCRDTTC